jgi:tRNA dimethylallyltransferase
VSPHTSSTAYPVTQTGGSARAGTAPVVVLGPTASGKSAVAMAAAQAVPGTEIVAVDAMQVYRGMDIGTAKPSAEDRAAVRHHCLDLVDPDAEFTVADYRRAFDAATATIPGRRLLVAGTGLYLTAVVDRLEVPGRWPELRVELERVDLDRNWLRLQDVDPVAASRIEPGNRRRIVRALEVSLGSGRPFSSFGPGVGIHPPTPAVLVGVRWPRPALAARIERRVRTMVDAGLIDEVRSLAGQGFSRTARQALGYKEVLDHLEGRISIDEAIARIITRTRQFAVRQERWYRRDPRVRWYDIDRDPVSEVVPAVADALRS